MEQFGEPDEILLKRRDQGLHECEIFGQTEKSGDSTVWERCKKNPNHVNFIPLKDLELSNALVKKHMAKVREKETVLDLIKALAALTVRLRVHKVSADRPKTGGYPFSNSTGSKCPHVGTGWVYNIFPGRGLCPCEECSQASQPKQKWCMLEIFTACHVVYNTEEAIHTEVEFFYDEKDSRSRNQTRTVWGMNVQDNNCQDDVCLIQCALHDDTLLEDVRVNMRRFQWLQKSLSERGLGSFCAVVSHPHGRAKHVTLGEMVNTAIYDPRNSLLVDHMYTYTADTCMGSSGAPVLSAVSCLKNRAAQETPRELLGPSLTDSLWPGAGPHSWGAVDGKVNQCAAGIFYTGAETLSLKELQDLSRDRENSLS